VVTMPEPTVPEVRDADLQRVVDEELSRLPDHYRGVIVLCDLEGMTRKEAARQLGIPEGSVASRLARARVLLAKRLTQRGVALSGGMLAAMLSRKVASASAPPALVSSTIKSASLLAAGRAAGFSARVAALTEGMVKAMFVTKIKGVLAVVLVVAALAGAAGVIYQTQAAEQPKDSNTVVQAPKPAEKEAPAQARPAEKTSPKNAKKEQKVLTPEEAIKQRSTEEVTVQFRVTAVEAMPNLCTGMGGPDYYVFLKDGGRFTARLSRAADQIMRLGVEPVKHFSGKVVRVTGRVEPDSGNPSFSIWVVDLTHIEVVKE
jgi:DNA/RNA endonuclease YhcR with UshA esterase domain